MKRILMIILFFVFFLTFSISAQVIGERGSSQGLENISDSAHNSMRWRMIGPFRGGRTIAAAGIPGNPDTFYFGAVDGGLWRTTNSGETWDPLTDGQTNPSIGALAIAPSNEKVIYIGTGEADIRSDITYGTGVYKSTDGGTKWIHLGLDDSRHIGRLLIDPVNPDIVFVAALGHAYGPNDERGVFKTTDSGKTWYKVLFKNNETGAIDLAWDEKSTNVIYAAMWQAKRTAWSQYQPDEGPGSGIYKSTDKGNSWIEIKGNGFPEGALGRIGIAVVNGSNGNKIFALIESQGKNSGLYYSADGGKNWVLRSSNPQIITRMWYFGTVFIDPVNPEIIYIPNRSVFRSDDGGKTFNAIKGAPGGDDYHYLWIDPANHNRMIEASDQGAAVSIDYGKTWSSWYNQPTAQFYHIAVDDQFPYRIYGAQQDCGTVSISSRSDYGEISFRDWYSIGAGESGYIVPDPKNPNIVYGGSTYGGLFRYDHVTGQSHVIEPWLLSSFSTPMNERKYRFTWTSPIGFDPHDKQTLYFGSQKLLRTTDGGLKWNEVSPDLTGANPESRKDTSQLSVSNASGRGMGVVYSFSFSPLTKGKIWVGTDDGKIQLTEDNCKSWVNVTPKQLKAWNKISIIEASPFDSNTAYAAVDCHRLDDFTPYIYKTTDNGKSWELINKGIPGLSYAQAVRSDPVRKGLLYAGTETGVYVSFNDGGNWQPINLNLPVVSVRDLAVHDNDLIAATHGRAFWILDDLTPLRQVKETMPDAALFEPETAIRIRRSENSDTPLPPETPLGQNPPAGAVINYYLNSVPDGEISLNIYDLHGTLIRHYSSAEKGTPPSTQQYFMTEWLPVFRPLTKKIGINRFVWDLQYPPLPVKNKRYGAKIVLGEGTNEEPEGPMVLPGEYKIELIMNGKPLTQILKVKMDPRVQITDKALKDQLRLGIRIWNSASDRYALDESVNSIAEQFSGLKKITDPELESGIKSASERINEIKKVLGNSNPADLESAVFSADREPAQQMTEAFEILDSNLKNAWKNWLNFCENDLLKINGSLVKTGFDTIKLKKENPVHYKVPD